MRHQFYYNKTFPVYNKMTMIDWTMPILIMRSDESQTICSMSFIGLRIW